MIKPLGGSPVLRLRSLKRNLITNIYEESNSIEIIEEYVAKYIRNIDFKIDK